MQVCSLLLPMLASSQRTRPPREVPLRLNPVRWVGRHDWLGQTKQLCYQVNQCAERLREQCVMNLNELVSYKHWWLPVDTPAPRLYMSGLHRWRKNEIEWLGDLDGTKRFTRLLHPIYEWPKSPLGSLLEIGFPIKHAHRAKAPTDMVRAEDEYCKR